MGYLRGYSERGIDFDAATQSFSLSRPSPENEKFLDQNFDRNEGRWKIRAPSLAGRIVSFGKAVVSGTATPEVVARRRLSCFGESTEGMAPPCPALVRTNTGSYCGACSCGRWLLAKLDGSVSPKLSWAQLDCPLKRPGFSNEAKP